jgi:Phasin protein
LLKRRVRYLFICSAASGRQCLLQRVDFLSKNALQAPFSRRARAMSAIEPTRCYKRKSEEVMADELEKVEKTVEQSMENVRGPIDRFFEVFQKTIGMNPWTGTVLVDQMQRFAAKNVHASFEFVSQLSKAKSFPEVMQIQIQFVQAQFNLFSKQLKVLGDSYTKAIKDVEKGL